MGDLRLLAPHAKESDGRITDFQPYQGGPPGAWTDDTGMTLATCRGLLHAVKTGETVGMALRMAFSDWAGGSECRNPGKTVLPAAKEGIPDPGSWANGDGYHDLAARLQLGLGAP